MLCEIPILVPRSFLFEESLSFLFTHVVHCVVPLVNP